MSQDNKVLIRIAWIGLFGTCFGVVVTGVFSLCGKKDDPKTTSTPTQSSTGSGDNIGRDQYNFYPQNEIKPPLAPSKPRVVSQETIKPTQQNSLPKKVESEVFIRLNTSTKGMKNIFVNGKLAKIMSSTDYEAKLLIETDENRTQEIVIYCNNGDSCRFLQVFIPNASKVDNTLICKN